MSRREEMEATFEAILFVASNPVPRKDMAALFADEEASEVEAALEAVVERFGAAAGRGVVAETVGGGLRLVTRADLHGALREFFAIDSRRRLSMAALETLAIVAYRQPITAPEIQELRGVNSAGVLRRLLEHRLIRISGRKPVVGKPFLYGTTKEFVLQFGLGSLEDLPPLEDFEEEMAADADGVQAAAVEDQEEAFLRETAEWNDREEDDDG